MSSSPVTDGHNALRQSRTTCRSCYAGCGLVITVDEDDHVLRAEGDRDHPMSRGYSCGKGRAIPAKHHGEDRLLHPRLNGRQASWEECLSDLGDRLNAIRQQHGGKAIGTFLGTGGAYDLISLMPFMRLTAALQSPQRYSTGTVDVAPAWRAAQMVSGFHDMSPHWLPHQPGPSLAILMGINICVSHGYIGTTGSNIVRRLREYRDGGGEVWTIDPRRTKTAVNSDHHLALRPGSDGYVLAWLLRELFEQGADEEELRNYCKPEDVAALREAVQPFGIDCAVRQTGLDKAELTSLLEAVRRHRRVAICAGSGLGFSPTGLLNEWLRWAILIVTGSLDREDQTGMFFDATLTAKKEDMPWDPAPVEGPMGPVAESRPELPAFYGELPAAALADEIEAGNLRALIVMGGNPLIALPEPERIAKAMSRLEVLVTIDPFDTELAKLATHALPATWQLERPDVRQVPGRTQYAEAVVKPVGESKHGWEIMGNIGERLGVDLFGDGVALADRDAETCYRALFAHGRVSFDELKAAGIDGIATPRLDGWFRKSALKNRGWRLAPQSMLERLAALPKENGEDVLLVAGRVDFAANSMLYPEANRREEIPPAIHVSPDLSQTKGIADGDLIRISTHAGKLEGAAKIDANLRPGTVWMNHGWRDRNVNTLFDSKEIDRLTIQPYMSAIPIALERLG